MFGLSDKTIELLINYFQKQVYIREVRVYGSRATGNYRQGSDIDLVVFSTAAHDVSGRIKIDLEELPTPYLFDVADYAHVSNPALKTQIDCTSKPLFMADRKDRF